MSVLSGRSLSARLALRTEARIVVDPLGEGAIGPASIDVRLGDSLLTRSGDGHVDPRVDDAPQWTQAIEHDPGGWWLWPGVPYLGVTFEWLEVPADLGCQLQGRSTLARLFITLHQQAGWLDPGYHGRPTLELSVLRPTILRPRQPIGQLVFHQLDQPALYPYGDPSRRSRYQDDDAPATARLPEY